MKLSHASGVQRGVLLMDEEKWDTDFYDGYKDPYSLSTMPSAGRNRQAGFFSRQGLVLLKIIGLLIPLSPAYQCQLVGYFNN